MLSKIIPRSLNSFSSILELRDFSNSRKASMPQKEIRSSVSIAIIDDEKFKAHANLTNYGYKIQELPDITSLKQIEEFDVVLCDLMGVGQNFDSFIGGASIIKEIKENYPTKYVIAYTGARANTTEASTAKAFADDFMKKDDEISKWVQKLDNAIDRASDPYIRWLVTREMLFDHEVDIRKVLQLESSYVESISQRDVKFSKVKEVLSRLDLGGNSKGIVQSLIASSIYALIIG